MELKEKTKLSSRTLAKHLNQMTNLQIIEKKTDLESGKYPIPVLYKATHEVIRYIQTSITEEQITNRLESMLNKTKDPLIILDEIHANNQETFLQMLTQIQQNKNITNEEIYFYEESFLWTDYKRYISKLIEASRKIINNLNIPKSLINQAKRQIRISKQELKIYEKTIQDKKS